MLVGTVFTLFALAIPKLVAYSIPFSTLASTTGSTSIALSFAAIFAPLSGCSGLRLFSLLVLFNASTSVSTESFSIQQITNVSQQIFIRLLF